MAQVIIYYAVIENPEMKLDDDIVKGLPYPMASEILQYKKQDDVVRLTVGKYLLRKMLMDLNYDVEIFKQYATEESGKPFIPGFLPFNITHSGKVVACALLKQDGLIGIDAESIREIEITKFGKQFPPVEMSAILSAQYPQQAFFKSWTMKEAVMKADGRGMRIPLHSIRLRGDHATIDDRDEKWNLYELSLHESVKSHVCSNLELNNIQLKELSLPLLLS